MMLTADRPLVVGVLATHISTFGNAPPRVWRDRLIESATKDVISGLPDGTANRLLYNVWQNASDYNTTRCWNPLFSPNRVRAAVDGHRDRADGRSSTDGVEYQLHPVLERDERDGQRPAEAPSTSSARRPRPRRPRCAADGAVQGVLAADVWARAVELVAVVVTLGRERKRGHCAPYVPHPSPCMPLIDAPIRPPPDHILLPVAAAFRVQVGLNTSRSARLRSVRRSRSAPLSSVPAIATSATSHVPCPGPLAHG
jgi:hypothetical protein